MAFTFFFRDMHTLQLITQHVVPHLRGRQYVHVWDAGCANGAEPYSLAMLLHTHMSEFSFRNVRIWATDLEAQFAEVVQRGAYREEEVKRVPTTFLDRYFGPDEAPGFLQIAAVLRRAISFTQHDLMSLAPIREDLSMIVCKNVLLHLPRPALPQVFRMFHDALCPGGFLILEQTQKLPPEAVPWFEQMTGDGQVFRRAQPEPCQSQ
jgi:chemotaxis protein methyltransferase CheR